MLPVDNCVIFCFVYLTGAFISLPRDPVGERRQGAKEQGLKWIRLHSTYAVDGFL